MATSCAKHIGPIIFPCERCGEPWLAHSWGPVPAETNRTGFTDEQRLASDRAWQSYHDLVHARELATRRWLRAAKKRGDVTVLGGGWWQIAGIGRLQGINRLYQALVRKGLISEVK